MDTSALLHLSDEPERIAQDVRDAIDAAEQRFFSVASVWEMAIKISIGKLRLSVPAGEYVRDRLARFKTQLLPITLAHASAVEALPLHHRDPFDRLIVAQAMLDGLTVVSLDRALARYGIPVVS